MNRPPAKSTGSSQSRSRYGKEVKELQDALNQNKIEQKRDAIRKIIDAMTRGKDVSMLFPDIAKNMETANLELKKLVYLYIINYAKILPDLAIMAINSFRKDARDKNNPFLRALAIRTMGCIRVKQITEYLMDPLKESIKDEDSYVRKTAAICIAKLYEVSPDLIEEQGMLKLLENLLNDGNAMVVSNAVCALLIVQEIKGKSMLQLNTYTVQKILTAMNECNEWGVIYTLDALALYQPEDDKEAEAILERVSPRLCHQNPGVVLSACKIMMKYLDLINNPEVIRSNAQKMTAPLISLLGLGKEPEIVYVALKNINLIIQKRPIVIEKEIKQFFCNFNDPIYIKLQKLEILAKLANLDNIQQILHELKEYTAEVDVEFVRKAVRTIGRCAIKLDKAAEKCVTALWECLKTKVNYVVMESIIVIRDIFRKYPRKYEMILKDLCDNLRSLEDPEAKASMIWIIGEYVDTIENADDLLASFTENFKEEASVVQHATLLAVMKLVLQRPNDGMALVQGLLKTATTECENPDLRDRAFIYWRLLTTNPELTKQIVFAERSPISEASFTIENELLDKLIENIGNLSSIYYKKPESFVKKLRDVINRGAPADADDIGDGDGLINNGQQSDDMPNAQDYQTSSQYQPSTQAPSQIQSQPVDLLDLDDKPHVQQNIPPQVQQVAQQPQQVQQVQQVLQPISQQQSQPQQKYPNIRIPYAEVLPATQPGQQNQIAGLQIESAFQKNQDKIVLELKFTNRTQDKTFADFAIKFNNNPFKLQPDVLEVTTQQIGPGTTFVAVVGINTNGPVCGDPPQMPYKVQVALKTNIDVYYFNIPCSLTVFFAPNGLIPQQKFVEITQNPNIAKKAESIQLQIDPQALKDRFEKNYVYLVGIRKDPQGNELLSYSIKLVNEMILILNVIQAPGVVNLQLQVPHPSLLPLFYQAIGFILTLK